MALQVAWGGRAVVFIKNLHSGVGTSKDNASLRDDILKKLGSHKGVICVSVGSSRDLHPDLVDMNDLTLDEEFDSGLFWDEVTRAINLGTTDELKYKVGVVDFVSYYS